MEELKAFMKEVFCKAILFLIISVSAFSGQYKDALVNRMSDLRRSVFATVNAGNDFEQKEALRKMWFTALWEMFLKEFQKRD